MVDEGDDAIDNEFINKVVNLQIGDVVVNRIGFKNVESVVMTLKQSSEQRPINVRPLMYIIQTLPKQ